MTEKTALPRSQPPTDLFSYEGPPQGDYVRYVDRLMAWAEQEQARTSAALALPQGVEAARNAQEELLRRVAELQQRAAAGKRKPVDEPAPISKPRTTVAKPKGAVNIAWMVFFVALLILAPGFAPLVIVLWVLWKVRRWWRSVAAKA